MGGEGDVLAAGSFGAWLRDVQAAIRGERDADPPCAGCTACCTASQFIHIGPDEADTLAHIPAGLLFPAPLMPEGHVVLGHDERGHCPMLRDGRCSIYPHRPRTCRTYDCRVFAAAGVTPEDGLIAERAARWRFDETDEGDRRLHAAVRRTAVAIRERSKQPANATQLAVLAVELHDRVADPASPSGSDPVWNGSYDDRHGAAVDAPGGAGDERRLG
jgi:Fe-S-cluster containining protein